MKTFKLNRKEKRALKQGAAEIKRSEFCTLDELKEQVRKKK